MGSVEVINMHDIGWEGRNLSISVAQHALIDEQIIAEPIDISEVPAVSIELLNVEADLDLRARLHQAGEMIGRFISVALGIPVLPGCRYR